MGLDELDKKILYHLDIDSRQSAKEIAKKAGSNKDTVNYRMNRLVREGYITGFLARVDVAKFGFNNTKVYFRFQDTDEKKEEEFFEYLKTLPEVAWAVQASGRWDALIAVWNTSIFSFYNTLSKIMNRFSRNIYEKEIIQNVNWFYYNRKWLQPEEQKIYPVKYGEEPGKEMLDKVDFGILKELTKDARKSFSEIGKNLKTSPQNVMNRVKSMRERGVIAQYGIDLDYGKFGIVFCKAFIELHNINRESLDAIYGFCAREPRVFALTTAVGTWDLELETEVEKMEEMMEVMNRIKRAFPDFVKGYESIVITKERKLSYVAPAGVKQKKGINTTE